MTLLESFIKSVKIFKNQKKTVEPESIKDIVLF